MQQFGAEESIYNIVPRDPVEYPKEPLYKSIHNASTVPTGSTFGNPLSRVSVHNLSGDVSSDALSQMHEKLEKKTIGISPGVNKPDEHHFLRKQTKNKPVETLHEMKRTQPEKLLVSKMKTKTKEMVPHRNDAPIMNIVSNKNYIRSNIIDMDCAKARVPKCNDNVYINKKDFGKVPKYLSHVKADLEEEKNYISQLKEEENARRKTLVTLMTEEEKKALIDQLKLKWDELNKNYQTLTHLTVIDCRARRERKVMLEQELSKVEQAICKLNKNFVFVDNVL